MPPAPTPTGTLDPQIVNLAKAIRQTESQGNFAAVGKSGEYGAYQFMPSTWAASAPKYGVNVPLKSATPEQQNEVAYKQLAEWKLQNPTWNIGNFASAWNAGPGKPDAYLNNVGTNSLGVAYDTPTYAKNVAKAYQLIKAGTQDTTPTPLATSATPTQEAPPSMGGFAHNVLTSGAGLLANVGEALLHPIQTVQNVGGAAVGGLEKAAGQTNENTGKFDNLVTFFKDRYGSLDNLEKTLYHDPVGVAADLSTLLGGAGLGLKAAGLGAKVADVGNVASKAAALGSDFVVDGAGNVVPATRSAAGVTSDILSGAGSALNKASIVTNPLTPLAAVIGKLANAGIDAGANAVGKFSKFEPATIEEIRANPSAFTPESIANTTRDALGSEVESVLRSKIATRAETTAAYAPIREAGTEIPVAHNFLENQLRSEAGVDVVDGKVIPNSSSKIRTPGELNKLQATFDLYKPDFQKGKITAEKLLNLRQDLGDIAYNDIGKKNTNVARVTDNIRRNINDTYRGSIPGLKELDERFATQTEELKQLRKGIIDSQGKLTDNAFNLVANAGNKGNEARLARLEQLLPGITGKIKVLKAIEDIRASMGNKVGTYTSSIAEAGGIVGGLVTGHLGVAAASFAAMIISEPANAVKIIRVAAQLDPSVVPMVLTRLARYATMGSVGNNATSDQSQSQSESTDTGSQSSSLPSDPSLPSSSQGETPQPQDQSIGAEQ